MFQYPRGGILIIGDLLWNVPFVFSCWLLHRRFLLLTRKALPTLNRLSLRRPAMANRRHPMQLPRTTVTIVGIAAAIIAITTLRVSTEL
jgi:hypothetical protein